MASTPSDPTAETSVLASFVSGVSFDSIPEQGLRLAERCFLDTIGVALAGVDGAATTAARTALTGSHAGESTLLGLDEQTTPAGAAFVNATAGHELDFDDGSKGTSGHPSVTIIPPILAVGEQIDASGEEALAAYIAGFETQCYLSDALNPGHYEAGWHATATLGTFGAAMAVANLFDLDGDETRHALGIAASMPAGLKRNFGSETKPIHAGQAARSGLTAAALAKAGATADPEAIAGEKGFFDLYRGEVVHDTRRELGAPWAIVETGIHVKKYPCCYFTHTGITATLDVVSEYDIDPTDVKRVRVVASQGCGDALQYRNPTTGPQAKFSMEYVVASAIVRERVDLRVFEDDAVADERVRAVIDRVSFDVDPDLPYHSYRTRIELGLQNGRTVTKTLEQPPGTHDDPLSDEELRAKFVTCAGRRLDESSVQALSGRLSELRSEESIVDLLAEL